MKASVITIGDEILIGQVIDSNSAYIAKQLNSIGIEVYEMLSVSDASVHLINTLDRSLELSDILILTGGLGPTSDDGTKEVLAGYFKSEMAINNEALENIKQFLSKRNMPLNKNNKEQSYLPVKCKMLPNTVGTASGMWFEKDNKIVISLPGVPFEMESLVKNYIIPELKNRFELPSIVHKTIITQGIPEAVLAEKLIGFEKQLPAELKLAYLPNPKMIRLRFTGRGNKEDLNNLINEQIDLLKIYIPENIISEEDEAIEETLSKLLRSLNKTISVAESCSGGYISHLFTLIPGASDVFTGSVISYSNSQKEKVLGVSSKDLLQNGAVSEPVVRQMATGVLKLTGSDYSMATSGIAGPAGGSPDKPIGTVWIAVASKHKMISKKFQFGSNRERNIMRTASTALNMVRQLILEENTF